MVTDLAGCACQGEAEDTSVFPVALHSHLSAELVHDALYNGEPQTVTFHITLVEPRKGGK